MKFVMNHCNVNVRDLEKSVKFYQEAFGLEIVRTHEPEDKSFKLAFLEDANHFWRLELTWLRDHADKMGIICFENPTMGIYFVEDPDGYWVEVTPPDHR